jgi:hypothetical protein
VAGALIAVIALERLARAATDLEANRLGGIGWRGALSTLCLLKSVLVARVDVDADGWIRLLAIMSVLFAAPPETRSIGAF